ncbi:microtubule organization protein AKNA [Salarias fasciatus]|uniref:microtubule organization protein AKNA n=1 Tax=Salarias fasciatus TaxID=181472 RepID=UPI001176C5A6|nr:microtubule organization protein AKNA [Salarias fasciatus]
METRRNTTAGVPIWTPAPVRTSPTSTEASDDIWEEEEEEEEDNDDFESQMDDNGIIGLETVEMREALSDVDVDGNNIEAGFKSQSEDEDVRQRTKQLDMTEEEEEEEIETSGTYKDEQFCTSGDLGAPERDARIGLTRSCSVVLPDVEPAGVPEHQLSQSVPALTHLLHFTAEEFASAPGIDAETFPEISLLESLPDSHSSHKSSRSCRPRPEPTPRASPQPAAMFSERVASNRDSEGSKGPGKRPGNSSRLYQPPPLTASPRTMKTFHTSTARTESVKSRRHAGRCSEEVDPSRKRNVARHNPDLSRVEAKVHFPKAGYKPPKSRLPKRKDSLAPEAPLVFKSPADIVKEVLLNTADEPAAPAGSVAVSTTPQDFRSRQQATSLLQQLQSLRLQDDYNRLLTKYAAAENTIDRLRLEAKVSLYSDPPSAGRCVPSGLNHDALKLIQLEFPQSSRAQIDSASPDGRSTPQAPSHTSSLPCRPGGSAPSTSQQLAAVLFSQADRFLQQLQTLENLLRSGKLKPLEEVTSLSHLAEGLDSLERGYLLARDEHRLLQQPGAELSRFDPERELEGLIFQCGLHLDEMKERVEQKLREEPVCEAPPPPPPPEPAHSAEWRGTPTPPQTLLVPSVDGPGEAAEGESSAGGEESDEEEARREEPSSSFCLKPPEDTDRRRLTACFPSCLSRNQSFRELPRLLVHGLRERVPLQRDFQPGDEERQGQRSKDVQSTVPQRTSKPHRGSPAESSALSRPSTPPRPGAQPGGSSSSSSSRRRLEQGGAHSSSLSSLGDGAASERRRSSKTAAGTRRPLPQDGIISPETDSGFIGSESGRPTGAAAQSPVQQRAPESAPQPAAARRFGVQPPRRSVQGPRRRSDISPQRWTQRTGVNTHGESDGERSEPYTPSADSLHTSHISSSSSSSSPAARRRHGDSLSSPQVAHCNAAIQTLQAEVSRLRERLESELRSRQQPGPPAEPRSSRHSTPAPTPRIRSAEQQGRTETPTLDEVDESPLRPTARRKSALKHGVLTRSDLRSTSVQSQTPQTPHVSRYTQTPAAPDALCSHVKSCSAVPLQRLTFSSLSCLYSHGQMVATESPAAPPLPVLSVKALSCSGVLSQVRDQKLLYCRRHSRSAVRQPSRSPEKAARTAAPPAPLLWQPACPHQLLLCSSPLYLTPPDSSSGAPPGVRGRVEARARARRSPSVDDSLDRAIRAARHMKQTSRHMARCLSAGLQHQELLAQSCGS